MSDRPKVYAIRPHELREQAMKWLAEVDDHLTTEGPDNDFTVTMLDGRTYQRLMDAPDAEAGLIADEHHARVMRMAERRIMGTYGEPDPSNGYKPGGTLPAK